MLIIKYLPVLILLYASFFLSFTANAQNNHRPFFARLLAMTNFDYETAHIKINGREATYNELQSMRDSPMLRVRLYPKKEAIKQFGKEIGRNGVILFDTKQNKPAAAVLTTEDSIAYYQQQGRKAFIKTDALPILNGSSFSQSWVQFLQKNLRSGVPVENGAPTGIYLVTVRYIINEDGSVSDVSIDQDPGYGTGPEVIRMMSQAPRWQPATSHGKPVKCPASQWVTFVAEESM